MGRKALPCNLTDAERKEAFAEFDDWLTSDEEYMVLETLDNYLFYRADRKGQERECICTHAHCGRFIVTRKATPTFFAFKHGDEVSCPKCGESVKLMALGRIRNFDTLNREKWKRVTICRTGQDGALLLMSGYAKRYFCWGDLRGSVDISWKCRTYLMPGKRMQWMRIEMPLDEMDACGRRNWGYKWVPSPSVREPFQPVYYDNYGDSYFLMPDMINESSLRYCQFEEWMYRRFSIFLDTMDDPVRGATKYLAAYTQYPAMEMAMKFDLHEAVTDLVENNRKNHRDLNWSAAKVQDFLRLCKPDAKAFLNAGGDLDLLKSYHDASRNRMVGSMQEYVQLLQLAGNLKYAERLTTIAKRAGCSIRAAVSYAMKFQDSFGSVLTTWGDYLNMARTLDYDLSRKDVVMPKNLQERHDAASETIRYQKIAVDEEKYKGYNKFLRKQYEFEYGDFCIVVPGSVEDIVNEGKTLKHCVGGYAARHFNHQVIILFLRHKRKPSVPFVTIEIVPRDTMKDSVIVRQIHGYQNETYLRGTEDQKRRARPSVKYKWFLDIWKAWVKAGSKRDKKGKPILPRTKEKTA